MSRMDWRRAGLSDKASTSLRDDREYRERDAASRWLDRVEKWAKPADKPIKAKHRRKRK